RFFRRRLPPGVVLVVVAERRLKHMFALPPDDLPSRPIVISAVIGINQESGNRVLAYRLKKILRSRTRSERPPSCSCSLFKRLQHFVLLLRFQTGKFASAGEHLAHSRLQFRQTFAVCLLV